MYGFIGCGAHDLRNSRIPGQAEDRGPGVGVPVRGAEADERRYQIDAAGVVDAGGERLAFAGVAVSALVVTLPIDLDRRRAVLSQLANDPRVTIGEAIRDRLPIVTATSHPRESVRLVEQLEEIEGVRVDLIAAYFDEEMP